MNENIWNFGLCAVLILYYITNFNMLLQSISNHFVNCLLNRRDVLRDLAGSLLTFPLSRLAAYLLVLTLGVEVLVSP